MPIELDSAFATAEDTAEELGVSKARLKRLTEILKRSGTFKRLALKAAKRGLVNGPERTPKRKQTRGKTKKAAR